MGIKLKGEMIMEKIYGYKEKDIVGLAEFIFARKGGTLSSAFSEYAKKSGKAKGTVRNLYYALAKKSNSDKEFCQKYFGGNPLEVGKIVEFNEEEEQRLIKAILKEKLSGKSVRKAISILASGDEKIALRYQNKFRNCLKNNPEKIEKLTRELISENKNYRQEITLPNDTAERIKRVKSEINGLVDKISISLRKENEKLKVKITYLQAENLKLQRELSKKAQSDLALKYFIRKDGNSVFN